MEITWRELLGKIVSDPQEYQRIIETLGVNALTLRRWVNGETSPRPQNLRRLLNVLPRYRKQLLPLLALEFPSLERENGTQGAPSLTIPANFYAQVMSAYTTVSPYLRSFTVCDMILQQLVKQLDPDGDGMLVFVAQCVPPWRGEKVRSLRMVAGRGTQPWNTYVEYHPQFFGAESLVGYAVTFSHLTIVRDDTEGQRVFPDDAIENMGSAIASPIVLASQTVGGIYIASTQLDFFQPEQVTLIQHYVELLCLAFERDEFYDLTLIELGIMPPRDVQIPLLISFQQRVIQQIVMAARMHRSMTRMQAEKCAWQQLEAELIAMRLHTSVLSEPVSI